MKKKKYKDLTNEEKIASDLHDISWSILIFIPLLLLCFILLITMLNVRISFVDVPVAEQEQSVQFPDVSVKSSSGTFGGNMDSTNWQDYTTQIVKSGTKLTLFYAGSFSFWLGDSYRAASSTLYSAFFTLSVYIPVVAIGMNPAVFQLQNFYYLRLQASYGETYIDLISSRFDFAQFEASVPIMNSSVGLNIHWGFTDTGTSSVDVKSGAAYNGFVFNSPMSLYMKNPSSPVGIGDLTKKGIDGTPVYVPLYRAYYATYTRHGEYYFSNGKAFDDSDFGYLYAFDLQGPGGKLLTLNPNDGPPLNTGSSTVLSFTDSYISLIETPTVVDGYTEAEYQAYGQLKYNDGYNSGYAEAERQAENSPLVHMLYAVFDVPVQTINGLLDFEVLGVNMKTLFMSLVSISLLAFLISKFKG